MNLSRHPPDLIGSGLSDKPDIDYRPEDLIDTIRGLMDGLGLPTLQPSSAVPWEPASPLVWQSTHPEQVDRLVLIDGFPDHVRANASSAH